MGPMPGLREPPQGEASGPSWGMDFWVTQAGAWLVREMEDFAHSIIVLKQARTIKYGSFVEPGRQLELKVEMASFDPHDCVFKGVGMVDGQEMVKGRITLTRYNLRERNPDLHATDASIVAGL